MQTLNQILSNSQSSFDLLNFIGLITTVIVSLYIFKSETSISFTRECHDKLIFPLFNLLEPVLYQQPNEEILNKALKLIEENKNLADGMLIELHYYCSKHPSIENFTDLCSYVSCAYDKSCRKLGLKTRSLFYRYARKQFRNKLGIVLFIFRNILLALIIMFFSFFVLLLVVAAVITIYNQVELSHKLFMLSCLIVLIFGIYKYINRCF